MLLLPVRTAAGISVDIGEEDESPTPSEEPPSPLVDETEVEAVSGSTSIVANRGYAVVCLVTLDGLFWFAL